MRLYQGVANMNLLHEYIRSLLVEQEKEVSKEKKIRNLFLSQAGGIQALELAELVGINKRTIDNMKSAIVAAHEVMSAYLSTYQAWSNAPARAKNDRAYWHRDGDDQTRHALKKLNIALYAVAYEDEDDERLSNAQNVQGILGIFDITGGTRHGGYFDTALIQLILYPHRMDEFETAEEAPAYITAVKWAGEPE